MIINNNEEAIIIFYNIVKLVFHIMKVREPEFTPTFLFIRIVLYTCIYKNFIISMKVMRFFLFFHNLLHTCAFVTEGQL